MQEKITSIKVYGETFPGVAAENLQNGMIYHDGSEIHNVKETPKSIKFSLSWDGGTVTRTVRKDSIIALSHEQISVAL